MVCRDSLITQSAVVHIFACLLLYVIRPAVVYVMAYQSLTCRNHRQQVLWPMIAWPAVQCTDQSKNRRSDVRICGLFEPGLAFVRTSLGLNNGISPMHRPRVGYTHLRQSTGCLGACTTYASPHDQPAAKLLRLGRIDPYVPAATWLKGQASVDSIEPDGQIEAHRLDSHFQHTLPLVLVD